MILYISEITYVTIYEGSSMLALLNGRIEHAIVGDVGFAAC